MIDIFFFLLGCAAGFVSALIASKRGPFTIMGVLILFSIPLFTIGPHPAVLGLFVPIALFLLRMGYLVLRNPKLVHEVWEKYKENGIDENKNR
tara:strand:+ start:160 stop:438 length:279 start_codon:yes stop_codon:yes gene_type:complete